MAVLCPPHLFSLLMAAATTKQAMPPCTAGASGRCGRGCTGCSIHSLFQPPSPADVTDSLNQESGEALLLQMQQQQQQQLADAGWRATWMDPQQQQQAGADSSGALHQLHEDALKCHQMSPGVRREVTSAMSSSSASSSDGVQDYPSDISALPSAAASSSTDATSPAFARDAVSVAGARSSSQLAGVPSLVGEPSLEKAASHEQHQQHQQQYQQQQVAVADSAAVTPAGFRSSQDIFSGLLVQGLFKGYPVTRRERGSWRPLR